VAHLPSFADFDFSFILFGAWFQLIGALASAAAGAYGASKSARVSQQNAREQRAWQTEMSNTDKFHQEHRTLEEDEHRLT
jgi:hypothetical protein